VSGTRVAFGAKLMLIELQAEAAAKAVHRTIAVTTQRPAPAHQHALMIFTGWGDCIQRRRTRLHNNKRVQHLNHEPEFSSKMTA
jgi:hypothetical protein